MFQASYKYIFHDCLKQAIDPYPLLFVTQRVEFYDIEAKDKIASVEETVCEEEMGDNDGKVEKFTEDEADEIVGVPTT